MPRNINEMAINVKREAVADGYLQAKTRVRVLNSLAEIGST